MNEVELNAELNDIMAKMTEDLINDIKSALPFSDYEHVPEYIYDIRDKFATMMVLDMDDEDKISLLLQSYSDEPVEFLSNILELIYEFPLEFIHYLDKNIDYDKLFKLIFNELLEEYLEKDKLIRVVMKVNDEFTLLAFNALYKRGYDVSEYNLADANAILLFIGKEYNGEVNMGLFNKLVQAKLSIDDETT